MPGLFSADAVSVFDHVLVDIFVPDFGLFIFNTDRIQSFVQAEIRHDRRDDLVVQQLAAFLHIKTVDIQDMISGHHIAVLINTQTAVRVTVISKTDIQSVFHHKFLQMFNVGRSAVFIDVQPVRLGIDHIRFCTDGVKDTLGDLPGRTVGSIKADLDIFEAVFGKSDEVADIAVASRGIIHGTANLITLRHRHIGFPIEIIFDLQQRFLIHLFTVTVDDLDPVVIIGIMRCGDHDPAVKIICPGNVGNGRSGRHMHDVGICTGSSQPGTQCIFKHIAGTAGIFSDHDLGFFVQAFPVIPAKKTSDLHRVIKSQINICLTTETVCSEIFSHITHSLSICTKFSIAGNYILLSKSIEICHL